MALDFENIRGITLQDMINDAVEKKNIEALRWLEDESNKMEERKHKDGSVQWTTKSVVSIRAEYLKKYTDYVSPDKIEAQKTAAEAAEAKKKKEREEMFANAFKAIRE